jgi:N4-(beta-N-acetylglucosaminyl)-L-asparaginase
VVAKYVLLYTDHVLLVGPGAKRFALSYGFKEEDLLTEKARKIWLEWKENASEKDDWGPADHIETIEKL